ncbi:hypothetical protein [Paenibacillus chitinolyticus]|uniref:hypothetical protein n=1 Tax=Paenibacillus chitinolyticus TaxID=79263 RepID=UPI00366DE16E
MPRYELSPNMVMNLLKFLNKTPLEGFDQQDAMYEIRTVLHQPLDESVSDSAETPGK